MSPPRPPVAASSIGARPHHRSEDLLDVPARPFDRYHPDTRISPFREEDERAHGDAGFGGLLPQVEPAELVDDLLLGLRLRLVQASDGAHGHADARPDRRARSGAVCPALGRTDDGAGNRPDDTGEEGAPAGPLQPGDESG